MVILLTPLSYVGIILNTHNKVNDSNLGEKGIGRLKMVFLKLYTTNVVVLQSALYVKGTNNAYYKILR